jgi:Tol biopolymer transport system component
MLAKLTSYAGLWVPALLLSALMVPLLLRGGRSTTQDLAVVQLTFDGPSAANHFPMASPDGRHLLFQRCDTPAVTLAPDGRTVYHFKEDDANWDIYRMRVDGSERVRLTDSPAVEDEPAWSPDGKTIAYRFLKRATFSIWLMDADGGNKRPLVEDPKFHAKTPSFSPDGRKVIFYANRAARQSWNIYAIGVNGGSIEQLTSGDCEDRHPQYAPEGREVIFHSDRDQIKIKTNGQHSLMRIFSLDLATGRCTPLTDTREPRDERHAYVAPDGRFLVYHAQAFGPDPQHPSQYRRVAEDIYLASRDGKKRLNLTQGDARYFKHPSWAADSKGIFCVFKEKRRAAGSSEPVGGWNVCFIDVRRALVRLQEME